MSTDQINYLNIGLMGVCLAAAFAYPFEFFLICYAFLSPLHYFSEISWLHQRQYFARKKTDAIWLAALGVFVFLAQFVLVDFQYLIASTIAFGFLLAFALTIFERPLYRLLAILGIAAWIMLFSHLRWYLVFFAIFMTTVVHTFIFTGAFMLKGALQRGSRTGLLSLVVFGFCVALCFLIVPETGLVSVSPYIRESYLPFWVVNSELMRFLGYPFEVFEDLYRTPGALMVMRFMAFVYSYHFMNWFSKTSLIGWHKGGKWSWTFILGCWGLCVGIFAMDYMTGITVIYFFSMLHVFLEFPLNHRTFLSIGRSLLPSKSSA